MPLEIYGPPTIDDRWERGIFLAGPIQGAPNWQHEAENYLSRAFAQDSLDVGVYNPRVDQLTHPKSEQTKWEKHYLNRARRTGVLLFWFAAQDFSIEDYPKDRPYAQTSRIELGRAFGWLDYDQSVRIALGIDPEYSGGNRDYFIDCANEFDMIVRRDLGDLCLHAADLIYS